MSMTDQLDKHIPLLTTILEQENFEKDFSVRLLEYKKLGYKINGIKIIVAAELNGKDESIETELTEKEMLFMSQQVTSASSWRMINLIAVGRGSHED